VQVTAGIEVNAVLAGHLQILILFEFKVNNLLTASIGLPSAYVLCGRKNNIFAFVFQIIPHNRDGFSSFG
jgi:hypothetical protein